MLGTKSTFFTALLSGFFVLNACSGSQDSDLNLNEKAERAPVPHRTNVLSGRLQMEGMLPVLHLCADTFVLVLDTTDDKVLDLIDKAQLTKASSGKWYVELDGLTEETDAADSLPPRFAGSIVLYDVLSMSEDTTSTLCR